MPRPTSHMVAEIFEQPRALRRTLLAEQAHAREFRRRVANRAFSLIVLVARGTSDNAAQFGRYLLELTTGIPVSLCAPSIHNLYGASPNLKDALVIGISQSGEATDVNWVLKSAAQQGALTVGITNEPKSAMSRIVDERFLVRAGRQRSVAATKTYTGQLLILYLLAYALGSRITLPDVQRIPGWAALSLRLAPALRQLAQRYRYMRHCVVVARGLNYANAFELSLKLMETSYVVAERFSSADFLHGPIALIEEDFPVLIFMPPGRAFSDLQKLLNRLRNLRAETIVISSAGARLEATRTLRVPGAIPELFPPIPYIEPGQLFAAFLAEVKGLEADKPRSLNLLTKTF